MKSRNLYTNRDHENGRILMEGTLDELRRHFMSNISVHIRHSNIPEQHFGLIDRFLESAGETFNLSTMRFRSSSIQKKNSCHRQSINELQGGNLQNPRR
ncbi:hypothetical protein PO124_11255 [Bacillus licheniformis]|nr:hypothetical protein [Bacillus licheniformis]